MRFHVTFGQRYATEPHPVFAEAHPDGYITIDAADESEARAMADDFLKGKWAQLYPGDPKPDPALYPRGSLATLTTRPGGAETLTGQAN